MRNTKFYDYLAPYVPAEVVTILSVVGFAVERILLPKVYDLYSNASLDPHTLLPFVFSIIALYLSVVSIYHAFRASARLLWFGLKWSIVIVVIWFLLGTANEIGQNFSNINTTRDSRSGLKLGRWLNSNWKRPHDYSHHDSLYDSFKLLISQSLPSFPDPSNIFESTFFSPVQSSTHSYRPSSTSESSDQSYPSSQNPPFETGPVAQKIRHFINQNVREPLVTIFREAKMRGDQKKEDARTSNR